MDDISKNFVWNPVDASIAKKISQLDKTPEAIKYFETVCNTCTDYAYWFFLSTLWVSYTEFSDLSLWKKLFSSDRPKRTTSIMKPSELREYNFLPFDVTLYRAYRPGEVDWISYTTNINTALRFAKERKVDSISEYRIKKKDILALFLRRNENEIIVLDKEKAKRIRDIKLIFEADYHTSADYCIRHQCTSCFWSDVIDMWWAIWPCCECHESKNRKCYWKPKS